MSPLNSPEGTTAWLGQPRSTHAEAFSSDHPAGTGGSRMQHFSATSGDGSDRNPSGNIDTAASCTSVAVVCGDLTGVMVLPEGMIYISAGPEAGKGVSPQGFEVLGGRAASRKWRHSIRLDDGERKGGTGGALWFRAAGLHSRQGTAAHVRK